MAKKSKKADELNDKEFIIIAGNIKDDFCHYEFEIKNGVGQGDIHKVKGSGIIDPELTSAMHAMNPHLAAIDEVFNIAGIDVEDFDKLVNNPHTAQYSVTGFKIKGEGDNETIILIGHKYLNNAGGYMALETPRIETGKLSSYKWAKELKRDSDALRLEVELYKGGKCTPVDKEAIDANQLTITSVTTPGDDNGFEEGRLN